MEIKYWVGYSNGHILKFYSAYAFEGMLKEETEYFDLFWAGTVGSFILKIAP